ncbi:hypothetical protein D3C77_735510 [compost metagenome]
MITVLPDDDEREKVSNPGMYGVDSKAGSVKALERVSRGIAGNVTSVTSQGNRHGGILRRGAATT